MQHIANSLRVLKRLLPIRRTLDFLGHGQQQPLVESLKQIVYRSVHCLRPVRDQALQLVQRNRAVVRRVAHIASGGILCYSRGTVSLQQLENAIHLLDEKTQRLLQSSV